MLWPRWGLEAALADGPVEQVRKLGVSSMPEGAENCVVILILYIYSIYYYIYIYMYIYVSLRIIWLRCLMIFDDRWVLMMTIIITMIMFDGWWWWWWWFSMGKDDQPFVFLAQFFRQGNIPQKKPNISGTLFSGYIKHICFQRTSTQVGPLKYGFLSISPPGSGMILW